MAVIGIDPGTAITGYGIITQETDGNLKTIDYGIIETSHKEHTHNRLLKINSDLERVLSLHSIQSAAVERLYFQKNVKTALSVGQARGVILFTLAKFNIEIFEYNPVEIKQAITGFGQASKMQMQEMVKILLGLEEIPRPDDAADALAVAICHIHSHKIRKLE